MAAGKSETLVSVPVVYKYKKAKRWMAKETITAMKERTGTKKLSKFSCKYWQATLLI